MYSYILLAAESEYTWVKVECMARSHADVSQIGNGPLVTQFTQNWFHEIHFPEGIRNLKMNVSRCIKQQMKQRIQSNEDFVVRGHNQTKKTRQNHQSKSKTFLDNSE